MTLSKAALSYAGIRDICDQALATDGQNELGVVITERSQGHAYNWRQRFYVMRRIDREDSAKIYTEGDPRRGRSPYDALIIEIKHAESCPWHVKGKEGRGDCNCGETKKVHILRSNAEFLQLEVIRA